MVYVHMMYVKMLQEGCMLTALFATSLHKQLCEITAKRNLTQAKLLDVLALLLSNEGITCIVTVQYGHNACDAFIGEQHW